MRIIIMHVHMIYLVTLYNKELVDALANTTHEQFIICSCQLRAIK